MPRLIILSVFHLLALQCTAGTILVKTPRELKTAVAEASPGDTIVLANGEWRDATLSVSGAGTSRNPIVIMPQVPGGVVLTGHSSLQLSGEHLVLRGFHFKNGFAPGKAVITFRSEDKMLANHCRITEVVIERYNPGDRSKNDNWVVIYGKHNRVDHCTFINKLNLGPVLVVTLDDLNSRENYHRIDSNYFKGRMPLGTNGGEAIRVGVSQHSRSASRTSITHNYFERCNGEAEIISVKSGENRIGFNTFFECEGNLVLRHGSNNTVEGNLFIGNNKPLTGGIRVINPGHRIFNNVFKDLTGTGIRAALAVMNGIPDSPLNRYHPVKDVDIHHNTFIHCRSIEFGVGKDDERTLPPELVQFRNNLILFSEGPLYQDHNQEHTILFRENAVINAGAEYLPEGFTKTISVNEFKHPEHGVLPVSAEGAFVSTAQAPGVDAVGADWFQ